MSSWGVKTPLRKQIITADFYWSTATELINMFHSKGFQSENRDYSEITEQLIQSYENVIQRPLVGCKKQHMIVFNIDGSISRKQSLCDCNMCYVGELQKCLLENPDGDNSDDDNNLDDDDDDEDDNIHGEMICEPIKPGQIIALRTPPEDKHSFYLVSVNEVKTAENDLFDAFQHFALRGKISIMQLSRNNI